MIKIYNRQSKKYSIEEQYGQDKLNILYNKKLGRILLKIVINPLFSKIYGFYKKSKLSKKEITKFIKKYNIDLSKYEEKEYKSFNDFFTRKLKTTNNILINKDFISPAESKLLVYKITKKLEVNIKGTNYRIKDLIKEELDEAYKDGNVLVFRLSMDNYHRYCFIDSGTIKKQKKIKGKLHTVSSISKDYEIYKENKRVVNFLKLDNFDEAIVIEVGALLVGDIINYDIKTFKKYDEKGYFNIGGSTIVVITKNNVKIDEDILKNSKNNIETFVNYQEKIGEFIC